jgi:hypothetical protein
MRRHREPSRASPQDHAGKTIRRRRRFHPVRPIGNRTFYASDAPRKREPHSDGLRVRKPLCRPKRSRSDRRKKRRAVFAARPHGGPGRLRPYSRRVHQDTHREEIPRRPRAVRDHRERNGEDSRPGGDPARTAAADFLPASSSSRHARSPTTTRTARRWSCSSDSAAAWRTARPPGRTTRCFLPKS